MGHSYNIHGTMITKFLVLAATLAASNVQCEDPTVKMTVYYESLCSDSMNFITTQLFPNWQHFGQDLKISFKPFGKANFTETETGWDFTCQHGPNECVGNKVHACALNQVTDPEEYVPLITCLMEIPAFDPQAAVDCLENLEISSTTAEAITECAMAEEGSNLLHDVFDQDLWNTSLNGYLRSVLCRNFFAGSSKC